MTESKHKIAVIGGTGDLGSGLALRWARAGHSVILGSRAQDSADRAVAKLAERAPGCDISGLENGPAAAAADVVVLTVPYSNYKPMLEAIKDGCQGKIMIDGWNRSLQLGK